MLQHRLDLQDSRQGHDQTTSCLQEEALQFRGLPRAAASANCQQEEIAGRQAMHAQLDVFCKEQLLCKVSQAIRFDVHASVYVAPAFTWTAWQLQP